VGKSDNWQLAEIWVRRKEKLQGKVVSRQLSLLKCLIGNWQGNA
jgi:hypothetical protein